jgi:hypothetical protein
MKYALVTISVGAPSENTLRQIHRLLVYPAVHLAPLHNRQTLLVSVRPKRWPYVVSIRSLKGGRHRTIVTAAVENWTVPSAL